MSNRLTLTVHAVRDTTSGEESGAGCYTRSRVLAAVRHRSRRRVLNVAFGIPLAAVLMGSVAWAASGQHLTVVVQYLSALTHEGAKHAPNATSHRANTNATHAKPQHQAVTAPTASTTPASAQTDPARADSAKAESLASTPPRVSAPPRDDEVTEREISLYEGAHRAHFVDKNWVAALGSWDEYLRKVPHGRFAVEARYNRALCLVRLGKTEQAQRALRSFAQASPGSYRQKEAQELLEQIEHRLPD